ncbi:uncharacterized protein LOC134260507 isoform X2 [Saccostrea cucullata]|uniref:uncharacterized protein LOC134260507 isoform X2 n=1 Tax=Saccostrea cuccullata TaxID=36930 RepID=UPI002ED14DCC
MERLYTIFWLAVVVRGKLLTNGATWKRSLRVCDTFDQRPLTEEDVISKNNTWMGEAKYMISSGVITLQIQRIEENETCSDCDTQHKYCQFCISRLQLNKSRSSFEELKTKLTPGQKYIIGDSWYSFVEEIPVPTKCLLYRGASHTEYVSCNNNFTDGCSDSNVSSYQAIVYFEENNDEGTTTYTSVESSHMNTGDKNENCRKCDSILPNTENIFILVGLFCFFVLINVFCVWSCINCQVKRQLRSLRIQQMNDNSCKPISEAITRMYKSINAFKEEQNDTYDLTASVRKKSNFAITSGMDDKNNYDTGFFRLLTQSGDYDMAWSNPCTSPTSPDAEYDHVQNVGAVLMTCLPDEEIYSKQKPLAHEISSDLNQKCNSENENPKEWVSEKTTESINGFFEVEEKITRSHNLDKFQGSDNKDIVGNAESDKGRQQKQNIVYEKKSKIHQKEPSLTDEAVVENRKKTADKDVGKGLEMGIKEQGTQSGKGDVKTSKVHIESKSGNNPPSSQRAGKVVDKATSLLVGNMNRVMSETKL